MSSLFDDRNALIRAIMGGALRSQDTLAGSIKPPKPSGLPLGSILGIPQAKRRRVFFSFHHADIMRVNNVRLSGEFVKSASDSGREIEGFYDNSLWESKKRYGDDAIKDLLRDGVKNSSAVCVLVGTDTWARRWVRYEIARAIIDGRGLLAVHVNGLNHHQLRIPHPFGENPLNWLGVGKVQSSLQTNPTYYLFEKKTRWDGLQYVFDWLRYGEYTLPVSRPRWLADPAPGWVMPLSANASVYDYIGGSGAKNIGAWIDGAAVAAGH